MSNNTVSSPGIKHQYHYGNMVLTASSIVSGKLICGRTIPARLTNGELEYATFRGFMDYQSLTEESRRIELVNITTYYDDVSCFSEGAYEIPKGHCLLGVAMHNSHFVVLRNGQPIHYPPKNSNSGRPQYRNNVVDLNAFRHRHHQD
ncbi:hypothetical protein [Vibrio mediterranei]|uniref:Uncharacterized protein n=1 Tax=Vibrio mediterranei TaxID=689 RepID=A0ABX5D633_9VIBR|nr:hypothetical protein [Vibrio mediterranei]PRQ65143.1 hypothetical protein COR51_23770 [Vibrio mediterranei]